MRLKRSFLTLTQIPVFLMGTDSMTVQSHAGAYPVAYKTTVVAGIQMFYREAGPKEAPVILLLHGFPSSSRMFATLMPLLADTYHLIAPDYPRLRS